MAKRKNKKLEWYAFREDFNSNEIIRFNVLGEWFAEEILHEIKDKRIYDMNTLKERVTSLLRYYYHAKAEHEVIVTSLFHRPDRDNEFKMDVYYQLEKNIDRIVEYIAKELQLDF